MIALCGGGRRCLVPLVAWGGSCPAIIFLVGISMLREADGYRSGHLRKGSDDHPLLLYTTYFVANIVFLYTLSASLYCRCQHQNSSSCCLLQKLTFIFMSATSPIISLTQFTSWRHEYFIMQKKLAIQK